MLSFQLWLNFILKEGLGIRCFILDWTTCSIWPKVKHTCTHPCHLATIQKINYSPSLHCAPWGKLFSDHSWFRWTTSWRVCKPNNSLTDQVMVYSGMFFQHQHTKGIFTLTHSYSSTASSFSRWVPRKSTAHFYYHPNLHLADRPFQQEDDARCQASFHLLRKCADIFCCGT